MIGTGAEKGIGIPDVDIASKLRDQADSMCWKVDSCAVGSSESHSPSRHRHAKNRDDDRHYKPKSSRKRSRSVSSSDSSDYSSDSESEDERRRRKRKERKRKREKEEKEVRTIAQMFSLIFNQMNHRSAAGERRRRKLNATRYWNPLDFTDKY